MICFNKMLNFKLINLKRLIRFLPNSNVSYSIQSVPVTCEPFMNGTSASYIEKLYWEWKADPQSVHLSWQTYFKLVESDAPPGCAYQSPVRAAITLISTQPATKPVGKTSPVIKSPVTKLKVVTTTDAPITGTKLGTLKDHLNLFSIVESYQIRGHLMSNLDPLQIHRGPNIKKRLDTEHNVVLQRIQMPTDLSIKYKLPSNTYIGGADTELTLKEIVDRLDEVYCGSIGVELNHLGGLDQEVFLKKHLESRVTSKACLLTNEQRITVLERLLEAHNFELYLSKKWPSEKRFGLEGCDVYVPAMRHIMEVASDVGGEHFVMGMAHRGRLNTLANVMEVPAVKIFSTFRKIDPGVLTGEGDVKYHLGATTKIKHARNDKYMRVSLCANPSHLESVNPIVTGKTAGEQLLSNDIQRNKIWPILVHGDAAVCGQGVVYETCHLSELSCYKTGGTVHVVINNQIGFTTDPYLSRSSEYCTAVAKVVNAPIFHVNSDEVEDVINVCGIAAKYRAKFKNDVVIDLVCYRRNGHNEGDEPSFTQPIMYKVIKDTKPVYFKYKEKLIAEKVLSSDAAKKLEDKYIQKLDKGFEEASKSPHIDPYDWLSSPWEGFFSSDKDPLNIPSTGIEQQVFDQICTSISKPPPNLKIHRGIERMLKNRQTMVKNKMVDWAVAESLAFASLLQEGIFVRLSGQDVERGTFSHRHHVLHDQEADKRVNVLENIFPNQAKYSLCNSSLSEFGVLGFEYGMTFTNPDALIIWEAQFADFINSAQIIIDQYLSSSEGKWFQQSGIVLLLPHGMEGQGPEHSSGRPERFLQLCNDDDININTNMPEQMHKGNWFIVNASTPANFFHVLRRQVKLNYRKPLIVFSPKFLLRYPGCVSRAEEFIGDTQFKPYISDPDVSASPNVTKLLLCTGKIYYELKEARQERKLGNEIAIGRIEQLSPLPYTDIMEDAFEKYPNARLFWVQEEHKNQGGWSYISPRLNKLLGRKKGSVTYIGRLPSASPATGHKLVHPKEREQLLVAAMTL